MRGPPSARACSGVAAGATRSLLLQSSRGAWLSVAAAATVAAAGARRAVVGGGGAGAGRERRHCECEYHRDDAESCFHTSLLCRPELALQRLVRSHAKRSTGVSALALTPVPCKAVDRSRRFSAWSGPM